MSVGAGLILMALLLLTIWRRARAGGRVPEPPLVVWRLVLPRGGRFGVDQAAALFASLSAFLERRAQNPWVELAGEEGRLVVRLAVPPAWEGRLQGQMAAWFPGSRLEPEEGPLPQGPYACVPLRLQMAPIVPLGLSSGREADPLLGLLGCLTQGRDRCGLRLTWGPPPRQWRHWSLAALECFQAGVSLPPAGWLFWPWWILHRVREAQAGPASAFPGLHRPARDIEEAARKAHGVVFGVRLFAWAQAHSEVPARARAQEAALSLEALSALAEGNRLCALAPQVSMSPEGAAGQASELVLSPPEMASLFHLPVQEHPLLPVESARRVSPAPEVAQAPMAGTTGVVLGEALDPAGPVPFGLSVEERRLHCYVVGKTGTGKSTLLAHLARQDLETGQGLGLLDPHGDLAEQVLRLVPPSRTHQVLYLNPADSEFPVSLNLLAAVRRAQRPLLASSVVGVFKKLFGESWGPRLEHFLRNSLLALLETPEPSLLDLPRLLTDRDFRRWAVGFLDDPLLRSFFVQEFEGYDARWRAEAVSPILNKVGQFLASPTVRHLVGQRQPGVDLRGLLDEGGILIANLASGRIGEDNCALLGGLLMAGLQLAALSRANQPEAARRDFHLLVDEFQHFANESFAVLLSEARKYRLSLTLSHQYLDQLPEALEEAVLGNVGALLAFRVGPNDAPRLVRELAPSFDAQDLVHLQGFHFCAKLTRGGTALPAFSARGLPPQLGASDPRPLIEASRQRWGRPRAEVELEIADRWEGRSDG